jgi:hypothetical protein
MKKIINIIIITLGVYSCSPDNRTAINNSINENVKSDTLKTLPQINFVKHFLTWFKQNRNSTLAIQLINRDDKYYKLDSTGVELYLKTLKKSGYFTDNYLDDLQGYIFSCGDFIRNEKQDDGPAYGFEGDLILKSNEVEDILNAVNDSIYFVSNRIDDYTFNIYSEVIPELDFIIIEKKGDLKIEKIRDYLGKYPENK